MKGKKSFKQECHERELDEQRKHKESNKHTKYEIYISKNDGTHTKAIPLSEVME